MSAETENAGREDGVLERARACPVCGERLWRRLFEHRDALYGLGGVFTVVQCSNCDLVSYDPLPDEKTLQTYYPPDYYAYGGESGRTAIRGLRLLLDDLHLGIRRNVFLAVLFLPLLWYKEAHSYARFLRPVPRGRLLDVGCGDGAFLQKADRMGFECFGLEPGGPAAPCVPGQGKDIPVFRCSLQELKGYDGFFDVITLNHVFEHLLDPEGALRRIGSLLKPGGRLLIRMPRTDYSLFRRRTADSYQLDVPRHVYLYTAGNFARLAERCGLSIQSCIPECIPAHYQYTFKKILLGKPFLVPHWSDARVFAMMLLPFCELLKVCGQADCVALWLTQKDADAR